MAALTPTYGLRGANTTSFVVSNAATADTISRANLIAGLSTTSGVSQLYTFLMGTYADAAAADLAFRAIGGFIDVRQTAGTAGTSTFVLTWTISATAIADLTITAIALNAATLEMTVGARQSIAQ